ncbi:uncharacterized protein LOC109791320, partial [Cajanus cajan]|uniref:uncharacterized protein LOC109791320 n=1 Tax=Cajanus cajan TaxID=3821 RepID=UPI00098D8F69
MQFLYGLNDQYSNVQSHILLMDPLPQITKIFSYVVQQERQLQGRNFAGNIFIEGRPTCTFCGKVGHNESSCFKKHGFPESKGNKSNYGKGNKTCSHSGRSGHTIDSCYRKHGFPPGVKTQAKNGHPNVNSTLTEEGKKDSDQTQKGEEQEFRLTAQQYHSLIALMQQSQFGGSSSPQINQISSSMSTSVQPSNGNLVLLNINTHHTKAFWDLNTLKKIGIVEMSNGLYILNAKPVTNPPSCSAVTHPDFSIIPIDLWNFRLGNPS